MKLPQTQAHLILYYSRGTYYETCTTCTDKTSINFVFAKIPSYYYYAVMLHTLKMNCDHETDSYSANSMTNYTD